MSRGQVQSILDGVKASSGNLTDHPGLQLKVSDDNIAIGMQIVHTQAVVVINVYVCMY